MSAVSRGHLSHSIFAYRGRLLKNTLMQHLKNTLKQHFKHVLKIFSAQLFLTFSPHFRKWSQIVKGGIGKQILKQEINVALKTHKTSRLWNIIISTSARLERNIYVFVPFFVQLSDQLCAARTSFGFVGFSPVDAVPPSL